MPARPALRTLVCVDDDTLILRALREQLLRGLGPGHAVELASGGDEALALIDELVAEGTDVPLVLSDHIMPAMKGTELLVRVHARHPQMVKILLTGQADVDAVGQALNEANLYRLLAKPWQERDLVMTVKEALRRIDQDRQLAERTEALAASHRALERSVELLRATMDATVDGLLVLDRNGRPVQANQRLLELWDVPPSVADAPAGDALVAHVRARLKSPGALRLDALQPCESPVVLDTHDGRAIEHESRTQRLHGEAVGLVCSFRDVTQRLRSDELMRHQALHDRLSGLPNRYRFDEALAQSVARARESGERVSVLFVDLDHFKRINDSLGHDVGDELLKRVGERLAGCVRDGDLVARWGGDEFTVLLSRVRETHESVGVAGRILRALEAPIPVGELTLQVSASIGMATFPEDGDDGSALLRRADTALYRVKADGRNGFQPFGAAPHAGDERLALESDLRRALERGELLLHYQPQVDTRTGAITHVEALARWKHPERGWISPGVFIPIAEQTGLVVPLGEWVLEQACRQAARWHAEGHRALRVGVNLSAVQFDRDDVKSLVTRALAHSGIAAGALEIEVTEAVALRHLDRTSATLAALREAGVSVALDDFGTGYASLAYLRVLPCDTLKVDRSFIDGLRPGSKEAAIIAGLVALGRELGLRVVAEGVESRDSMHLLQRLGCWVMQGYAFGRPVSAAELSGWLGQARRETRPAVAATASG